MSFIEVNDGRATGAMQHRIEHDATREGSSLVAGWTFDGGVLRAQSDRLGMIPLYYWTRGPRFILADNIAEVVSRIPDPVFDRKAVSVFLSLGFYLANDTPFAGVLAVPPAANVTFAGRVTVDAPPLRRVEPYGGTFDAAVRRYCELFEHAVGTRAAMGVGRLTLSGGRDSRHILFELLRQGHRPPAIVTQERLVNTDLETGRAVAARIGIPHIAVAPYRDSIEDERAKNRWNNYLADENSWYVQIAEHLQGPVFDGLAAGVLSGSDQFDLARFNEAWRRSPREAAAILTATMGAHPELVQRALGPLWSRDLALDAIGEELARHDGQPNPLKSFLFWNRTRREIALIPLTIAARHAPVRLPYTDAALADFLMSLPVADFHGYALHDTAIRTAYPEYADLPFGSKRKRAPTLKRSVDAMLAVLPYALRGRLGPRLVGASVGKMLLTRNPNYLAWFYFILPVLQAADDLNVPLRSN